MIFKNRHPFLRQNLWHLASPFGAEIPASRRIRISDKWSRLRPDDALHDLQIFGTQQNRDPTLLQQAQHLFVILTHRYG